MPRPYTHVIFDLDGTLLDTEPLYTIAAERVCARHGAVFTMALKKAIMGGDSYDGARRVIDALQLPLTPDAYLMQRGRELEALFPDTLPMPGAVALVEALRARNVPMAIATSGHRDVTETKLAYHPFLQGIATRVCGDDPRLRHGKPAPDIFLTAAEDLGADPTRCIVLEDSVLGVRAAVAAGAYTIALVDPRYGFTPDDFKGAERVVSALSEVEVDSLELACARG